MYQKKDVGYWDNILLTDGCFTKGRLFIERNFIQEIAGLQAEYIVKNNNILKYIKFRYNGYFTYDNWINLYPDRCENRIK